MTNAESKYATCPVGNARIAKEVCALFWKRVQGMSKKKAPASFRKCVGCTVGEESYHWTLMEENGHKAKKNPV